jgi:hypothetical protein
MSHRDAIREDGQEYWNVVFTYKGLRQTQTYGQYLSLQEAKEMASGLVAQASQETASANVLWYAQRTGISIKVFRAWREKDMEKGICRVHDYDPKANIPSVPQGLRAHGGQVFHMASNLALARHGEGRDQPHPESTQSLQTAKEQAIRAGIHPLRVDVIEACGWGLGAMTYFLKFHAMQDQGEDPEDILKDAAKSAVMGM